MFRRADGAILRRKGKGGDSVKEYTRKTGLLGGDRHRPELRGRSSLLRPQIASSEREPVFQKEGDRQVAFKGRLIKRRA